MHLSSCDIEILKNHLISYMLRCKVKTLPVKYTNKLKENYVMPLHEVDNY